MSVFVSHSFEDSDKFDNICYAFEQDRIAHWKPEEIAAGQSLRERLLIAINECSVCVFIATYKSLTSGWCQAEIGAFWGSGKPVVVYLVDPKLKKDLPKQFVGDKWVTSIREVVASVKRHEAEAAQKKPDQLQEFATRISGSWWQMLTPDEPCALTFVKINPQPTINALKLDGRAYNREGGLVTHWGTDASFIHLTERKVIYTWKRKRSSPNYAPYEGFGEINFYDPVGLGRVEGFFLDFYFFDLASTKKFSTEYWRPKEDDQEIMLGRNEGRISERIQEILRIKGK